LLDSVSWGSSDEKRATPRQFCENACLVIPILEGERHWLLCLTGAKADTDTIKIKHATIETVFIFIDGAMRIICVILSVGLHNLEA
jgi:hypothetical protein